MGSTRVQTANTAAVALTTASCAFPFPPTVVAVTVARHKSYVFAICRAYCMGAIRFLALQTLRDLSSRSNCRPLYSFRTLLNTRNFGLAIRRNTQHNTV